MSAALLISGCLAEDRADEGADPAPAPAVDGAALYVSKGCVGCHGPLATSQKRNATFARIRAAAGPDSQIVPMRGIQLTDDEIRALVRALADPTTPGAPDRRSPLLKPLLLTRSEVASRLYVIFRSVDDIEVDEPAIEDILEQYMLQRPAFFGGHCNRYDECGPDGIAAGQSPATSTIRAGVIVRACLDLLALPDMDRAVLAKVNLTPQDSANAVNIRALWDLFAPGRPLDDDAVSRVAQVAAADPVRAWANVLTLFCRPSVLEAI